MLKDKIEKFINEWPNEFQRIKKLEKEIKKYNIGKSKEDKRHRKDEDSELIGLLKQDMCSELYDFGIDSVNYKIEGSVGQGNIAEIPWICIYDRSITTKAANGFYIVYLFRPNIKKVFLSLNFGWTQFRKIKDKKPTVSRTNALLDIQNKVYIAQQLLKNINTFKTTNFDIDLSSELAEGYQKGSICHIEYELGNIPDTKELKSNLEDMLFLYTELKKLIGKAVFDIQGIAPEKDYQDLSLLNKQIVKTPKGKIARKEPIGIINDGKERWPRDADIAAEAKDNAMYCCEFDRSHTTFVHKKSKKQYVEAHHLIPMQFQNDFSDVSIDVPENIISLCPTCHRAFHSSDNIYRKKLINFFYNKRKDILYENREILIDIDKLYKYYGLNAE